MNIQLYTALTLMLLVAVANADFKGYLTCTKKCDKKDFKKELACWGTCFDAHLHV